MSAQEKSELRAPWQKIWRLCGPGSGPHQQASIVLHALATEAPNTNKTAIIHDRNFQRRVLKKVEREDEEATVANWFMIYSEACHIPPLHILPNTDSIHDITGFKHWVTLDSVTHSRYVTTPNPFGSIVVCAILKRSIANQNTKNYAAISNILKDISTYKPQQKRGKQHAALSESYTLCGTRRDPVGDEFGEYSFKPNTPPDVISRITNGLKLINGLFEWHCARIFKHVVPEDNKFYNYIRKAVDLPMAVPGGTIFSQLACGKNYISAEHVDSDMYYSCVCACSEAYEPKQKEAILQYFLFPDYQLNVPLRHGEVLLFNPLVRHCASNAQQPNTHIFSAYVPSKVALNATSLQLQSS